MSNTEDERESELPQLTEALDPVKGSSESGESSLELSNELSDSSQMEAQVHARESESESERDLDQLMHDRIAREQAAGTQPGKSTYNTQQSNQLIETAQQLPADALDQLHVTDLFGEATPEVTTNQETISRGGDLHISTEPEWDDRPKLTWVGQNHDTIETATRLAEENRCTQPALPIMDPSTRPTRVKRRPLWLADYRAKAVRQAQPTSAYLEVSGQTENNFERDFVNRVEAAANDVFVLNCQMVGISSFDMAQARNNDEFDFARCESTTRPECAVRPQVSGPTVRS